MKAKKAAAVIIGGAVVATAAFSLTACSNKGGKDLGTTTLDLSQYATDYAEYLNSGNTNYDYDRVALKTFVTYKRSEVVNDYIANKPSNVIVLKKGTGDNARYSAVDLNTGKTIFAGHAVLPEFGSFTVDSSYNKLQYVTVKTTVGVGGVGVSPKIYKQYFDYNGVELVEVPQNSVVLASCSTAYINGKRETVLCVTASYEEGEGTAAKQKTVQKFFKQVTDKNTGDVSYTAVSVNNVKLYDEDDEIGADHSGLISKIYNSTEEKPVESAVADYGYKENGSKGYTFYDAQGNETGKVSYEMGGEICFIGDNYYYYTLQPSEKDYNFVMLGAAKYLYTLHKYDVLQNSDTIIDCNVAITRGQNIYNYTTKSYDAAGVMAFKMVDGVAYTNTGYDYDEYVVDKDLKVAYNVTGRDLSLNEEIYGLGGDLYKIGSKIVDSNLNVVNKNVSSAVYVKSGLIKFSSGSASGFTDLNGKVVIAPEYYFSSTPQFYNGVAYATQIDVKDEQGAYRVLLKKDGTFTKIDDLEASTDKKIEKDVIVKSGYYVLTTTTYETAEQINVASIKYDVVSFDGTVLKTFIKSTGKTYNFDTDGKVTEAVSNLGETTYTVYKIA